MYLFIFSPEEYLSGCLWHSEHNCKLTRTGLQHNIPWRTFQFYLLLVFLYTIALCTPATKCVTSYFRLGKGKKTQTWNVFNRGNAKQRLWKCPSQLQLHTFSKTWAIAFDWFRELEQNLPRSKKRLFQSRPTHVQRRDRRTNTSRSLRSDRWGAGQCVETPVWVRRRVTLGLSCCRWRELAPKHQTSSEPLKAVVNNSTASPPSISCYSCS